MMPDYSDNPDLRATFILDLDPRNSWNRLNSHSGSIYFNILQTKINTVFLSKR